MWSVYRYPWGLPGADEPPVQGAHDADRQFQSLNSNSVLRRTRARLLAMGSAAAILVVALGAFALVAAGRIRRGSPPAAGPAGRQ